MYAVALHSRVYWSVGLQYSGFTLIYMSEFEVEKIERVEGEGEMETEREKGRGSGGEAESRK